MGGSWKTGGSLGSALIGGDDLIDFYKVSNASFASNSVRLDHVKQKHMFCDGWCNFDAGSGPYIDPSGNVIWYGVEHQDSALSGAPPAVKMREYAP